MTTDELFVQFQNPGAAWRGKPFWAWNGRLDKAELLRQVHVMKEMGLGGFFMHSRVGLATEYLGDEWFECINACADEAEKLGMEAWLYDEDRWPSGSAGGLVTQNPDFRMRFLRCTIVPEAQWAYFPSLPPAPSPPDNGREGESEGGFQPPPNPRPLLGGGGEERAGGGELLAAFACELAVDGLSYHSLRRVAPGSAVPPGFSILEFTVEEMARSNFYNGYTYLDTMSRAATDAFLKSTHEKYVAKCGDRLGKNIKGIFTDEPHRGSLMTSFGQGLGSSEWIVPWTPQMPEHWEAAYGDDLLAHLPEIFLLPDGQAVHPTKWKYVELCLSLFTENFCKPLDAWCREHNLILTGHFLHEDNLTSQVAMNGSMMRCYEFMQYPGMDLLTEGNKAFWVAKQLQSVGRQLGKPWLMSELYGCTGWQMGLEGHKHVGDWQALFGVNLRCHHLSWYTMEGEAKRDYPASILHQSAWWKDYSAVETYFARLGFLLSQGEPICDVLVIHPVEGVWAQIHPGWCNGLSPKAPAIQKLETQFAELFHWLQGAQIDFDYGDEGILAEHGKVFGTQSKATPLFDVGKCSYETVIIGGLTNIRSSTLELLEEFVATGTGGQVIFVGEPPTYVDGVQSDRALKLATRCQSNNWGSEALLEKLYRGQRISSPSPEVFAQSRRLIASDGYLRDEAIVALNSNREVSTRLDVVLRKGEAVEVWDCLTGTRLEPPIRYVGGPMLRLSLLPGELVCVILRGNDGVSLTKKISESQEGIELPGPFAYSLDEPNALVLDTATWELTPANPLTPARRGDNVEEILKIDQAVRRHFGLEVRGGEMVQPWYAEKFHGEPPVLGTLTLRFTFDVEVLPRGEVYLVLERPERFTVLVNSAKLTSPPAPSPGQSQAPWGRGFSESPFPSEERAPGRGVGERFWIDACFKLLEVPEGALKLGENVVTLTTEFRRDSELEAIYLLGDFGVRLNGPKRTIIPLPEALAIGDVCEQGLPFYSGCVTYHLPAFEGVLELPEIGGACVRVNGQTNPWPPYTSRMTGEGCEVTVVLTRRNLFGPLHLVPKQQAAYGPGHWVTEGGNWSDDYQLYPSGLLAAPCGTRG